MNTIEWVSDSGLYWRISEHSRLVDVAALFKVKPDVAALLKVNPDGGHNKRVAFVERRDDGFHALVIRTPAYSTFPLGVFSNMEDAKDVIVTALVTKRMEN